MNGWQRLFIFICGLVLVPVLVVSFYSKPKQPFSSWEIKYSCDSTEFSDITYGNVDYFLAKALEIHNENSYWNLQKCLTELHAFKDGVKEKEAWARWWSDSYDSIFYSLVFLFIVYAIGRSIGWVWRGFRPKKT